MPHNLPWKHSKATQPLTLLAHIMSKSQQTWRIQHVEINNKKKRMKMAQIGAKRRKAVKSGFNIVTNWHTNCPENVHRRQNHWHYLLFTCLKTPNIPHTTNWNQQELHKINNVGWKSRKAASRGANIVTKSPTFYSENFHSRRNHWHHLLMTSLKTPNMRHTTHRYQQDLQQNGMKKPQSETERLQEVPNIVIKCHTIHRN